MPRSAEADAAFFRATMEVAAEYDLDVGDMLSQLLGQAAITADRAGLPREAYLAACERSWGNVELDRKARSR